MRLEVYGTQGYGGLILQVATLKCYDFNMPKPIIDYRDFVSFEVPGSLIKAGVDPNECKLPGKMRRHVETALSEFASTPEGASMLERAARGSPAGKVHIAYNAGGGSWAIGLPDAHTVAIGSTESSAQYRTETGDYQDLTVQRLLYHELQHLALDHHKARGDEVEVAGGVVSASKEAEAIRATNIFMERYYGEPGRTLDVGAGAFVYEGGDLKLELNKDFQAGSLKKASLDELRGQFAALSAAEVRELGPEIQSLYEVHGHAALFEAVHQELEGHGGLEIALSGLLTVIAPEASIADTPPSAARNSGLYRRAGLGLG